MVCGSSVSIRPLRFFQSLGLTPTARTAIRTWPGPGCGSGRSTISRTSGPPNRLKRTAFIIRSDLTQGVAPGTKRERVPRGYKPPWLGSNAAGQGWGPDDTGQPARASRLGRVSIALTLLAEVRWRGRPVAGDRPQALLAALAARDCRPVRPEELIELVWGEDAPSNGQKSLQVLVSRARTAYGADAIVRDGAGYRLGAAPGEVDSI